jgi:hypothetical protein
MLAAVAQVAIAATVWRTETSMVEPFCTLFYVQANPPPAAYFAPKRLTLPATMHSLTYSAALPKIAAHGHLSR